MNRQELEALIRQTAVREGVPPELFMRVIGAESSFNHGSIGAKGERGLAQLMPDTAKELGVDPSDIRQNLAGGARYLRQQIDRFGSYPLALAAYNAGPSKVARAGNKIPNISTTQDYVNKIMEGLTLSPLSATRRDDEQPYLPALYQQPQPQQRGLMGFLSGLGQPSQTTGLNFMNKLGMAAATLNPMNPMSREYIKSMQVRGQQAIAAKDKNRSVEYLKRLASSGNAKAQELVGAVNAGAMSVGDAFKLMYDTTGNITRNAYKFPNGAYYRITDTGREVFNPQGKKVFGEEAEKVLIEAQKSENELQAQGVGLSEAAKLQQKNANNAFESAGKITNQISTIDRAIRELDAGAKTGLVYNMLPNITKEAGGLQTALNQMSLDIVQSVTFGALSEKELDVARATAYPPNASAEELREFLVTRKAALTKLRKFTEDAAKYLANPNNNIAGYIDILRQRRDVETNRMSGNPYMNMNLGELNDIYAIRDTLSPDQLQKFTDALEAKAGK